MALDLPATIFGRTPLSASENLTDMFGLGRVYADLDTVDVAYDKYRRDSDHNGPKEDLINYTKQAIASLNKSIKKNSQRYTVVDITRSEEYVVSGLMVLIDFTAKHPNQDDADAITFRAELWVKIGGRVEVHFVRPITEEEAASDQMRNY